VAYQSDASGAELRMDIAGAYPKQANLESWHRSVRLDRAKNQVEIADEYALKQAAREITLTLMTPCRVTQESGALMLEGRARVVYDAALTPRVEEIKLEDDRLRSVWGDKIYRILLRAANPPRNGKWQVRITAAG
jgi:hypothetical protein